MGAFVKLVSGKLFLVAFLALIIRLALLFTAFHGDLNNNISWGKIAYEGGLNGFYGSPNADDWPFSAPNQPPLTILLFMFTTYVWNLVNSTFRFLNDGIQVFPSPLIWFWADRGMTLLVKLPSIICDLAIGVLIYQYVKKLFDDKKAFTAFCIWLFNPVVFYNSAVWGQTDSIVNLLGLIAIFNLLEKKLLKFSIYFSLSILFKGSLAIFIPILFFVALKQKYKMKEWTTAIIYSIFAVILTSMWFHPYLDFPLWFYNLYIQRILPGEIGYLTANAFNFWWLVDNGKVYDSVIYFSLPARIWSLIAVTCGNIYLIFRLSRNKLESSKVLFALAISALMAFLFLTRIHERYLYPFFPYATLLIFNVPGLLFAHIALSAVHVVNLYNLFFHPDLPVLVNLLKKTNLPNTLALLSIFLFIYILVLFAKVPSVFRQKGKKLPRR